jgi:mannose-6-phosphate isomerase-like protein (cupin superfamily)
MDQPGVTTLPDEANYLAPDGSEVRLLSQTTNGSMAHFTLGKGKTSLAVSHKTVEELWWVQSGNGEIWLNLNGEANVHPIAAGSCIAIPVRTEFQFRAFNHDLCAIGVTMPPWPGPDEATPTKGPWKPTLE